MSIYGNYHIIKKKTTFEIHTFELFIILKILWYVLNENVLVTIKLYYIAT